MKVLLGGAVSKREDTNGHDICFNEAGLMHLVPSESGIVMDS